MTQSSAAPVAFRSEFRILDRQDRPLNCGPILSEEKAREHVALHTKAWPEHGPYRIEKRLVGGWNAL